MLLLDLPVHVQYVCTRVLQWQHVWHCIASVIMNIHDLKRLLVLFFDVLWEIIPPPFDICMETQEPVSPTTASLRSLPGPLSLATVLVLVDFGGRCGRACSLSSRNGFRRTGSTLECIGSFVRVTSVTCGGLSSKRISVSELFLLNFSTFTHASVGKVPYRTIAMLPA